MSTAPPNRHLITLETIAADEMRALFASAEGRIIYLESFTRGSGASPSR